MGTGDKLCFGLVSEQVTRLGAVGRWRFWMACVALFEVDLHFPSQAWHVLRFILVLRRKHGILLHDFAFFVAGVAHTALGLAGLVAADFAWHVRTDMFLGASREVRSKDNPILSVSHGKKKNPAGSKLC